MWLYPNVFHNYDRICRCSVSPCTPTLDAASRRSQSETPSEGALIGWPVRGPVTRLSPQTAPKFLITLSAPVHVAHTLAWPQWLYRCSRQLLAVGGNAQQENAFQNR